MVCRACISSLNNLNLSVWNVHITVWWNGNWHNNHFKWHFTDLGLFQPTLCQIVPPVWSLITAIGWVHYAAFSRKTRQNNQMADALVYSQADNYFWCYLDSAVNSSILPVVWVNWINLWQNMGWFAINMCRLRCLTKEVGVLRQPLNASWLCFISFETGTALEKLKSECLPQWLRKVYKSHPGKKNISSWMYGIQMN